MRIRKIQSRKKEIVPIEIVKLLYRIADGTFYPAKLLWFDWQKRFGFVQVREGEIVVSVFVHHRIIRNSNVNSRKLLNKIDLPIYVRIGLSEKTNRFEVKNIMLRR